MTYEKTKERSKQITDAGYNLIEMWECEWVKSTDYRSAIKTLITLLNLWILEMLSMEDEQTLQNSKSKTKN